MFHTFVSYHTQLLVDVNNIMLLIRGLLSCFLEIGILVVYNLTRLFRHRHCFFYFLGTDVVCTSLIALLGNSRVFVFFIYQKGDCL